MRQFTDEDLVQLRQLGRAEAIDLGTTGARILIRDLAQALAGERIDRQLAGQRLAQAMDLLDGARCQFIDPGLVRSWAQRRRRLRDAVER